MILCQAHKGPGYWRWRLIDGRRCWYEGHKLVAKGNLTWEVVGPRVHYTDAHLGLGQLLQDTPSPRVAAAFEALAAPDLTGAEPGHLTSVQPAEPGPTRQQSHALTDLWPILTMLAVIVAAKTAWGAARQIGRLI